jgi:phytoene dehydrogenase-like protein
VRWDPEATARHVGRIEDAVERHAPGFRAGILARRIMAPPDLEASNANLVEGAIGGGTANIHQQLIFRPIPGMARAETPIDGVYLASASAHPGGGVHGGPGANAAAAAIARAAMTGPLRRAVLSRVMGRLYAGQSVYPRDRDGVE